MNVLVPTGTTPTLPVPFLAPPHLRWGTFPSNGAVLRSACLPAKGDPRATCILVGGFCEFAEKYFETMAELADAGLTVWFLDWRGQGGSERPANNPTRPLARDFARDADDLAKFAAKVLPPQSPRILIAHSMGGAIGLLMLSRHPEMFQAAVLSAPMLEPNTAPVPRPLARAYAGFMCAIGLGHLFAPGQGPWTANPQIATQSRTSHDPVRAGVEQAWFLAHPQLRVDGPTIAWVHAALLLGQRLNDTGLLHAVTTPILMGCAGEDAFVDAPAIRRAATLLPRCELKIFDSSRHELFMESDVVRTPWLAAIGDFLHPWLAQPSSRQS